MKWQAKVTVSNLITRIGPSNSYRTVNKLEKGHIGTVIDSKTVGNITWYKWEDGTWSSSKSTRGDDQITIIRELEPNTAAVNNINNSRVSISPIEKPYITTDKLYSFYNTNYGSGSVPVSVASDSDWYIESSYKFSDHPELDDIEIRDEISRIKYNMDISYATKDDVYEVGEGSSGYVTDLQAKLHHSFNRNKVSFPDRELTKTFAYVFFTRPDLNILDYGAEAGEFTPNHNVASDPKYSYLFRNNSNTLRSLVTNGNPYHKFLILLSNEAQSFEVSDNVLKTMEHGETFNGNKIIYGTTDYESNAAGEINIRYIDTANLDIFKMHLIWVDYINKVSRGVFDPKETYMKQRVLDYACSCYYFLCGPDGSTILYWQKLIGVFPVNTGENAFSWDSGTLLSRPEINIRYMYSMRDVMNIAHLSEFNSLTKINGSVVSNTNLTEIPSNLKSPYSPQNIQTGSTLTHSPYVWQTTNVKGQIIYRLMWCDN